MTTLPSTGEPVLITNHHVIAGANSVVVLFPGSGAVEHAVDVLCDVPEKDLAILRLQRPVANVVPLAFGNADTVACGAHVRAGGFPLGQRGFKLVGGSMSGNEMASGHNMIQTSAPLCHGSGPL